MYYEKWTKSVLIAELIRKDRQLTDLKAKSDSAHQTRDFLQQRFTEETIKNKVLLEVIDHLTRR
jgi:hypothetical protein